MTNVKIAPAVAPDHRRVNFLSPSVYLVGLVVGSGLVALAEGVAAWQGVALTSFAVAAWPFLFCVLLVLWVIEDSRHHAEIYKPFEFDYLVLLWVLPYLPYYLWRTRRARGLLMLLGFIALFWLDAGVRYAVQTLR